MGFFNSLLGFLKDRSKIMIFLIVLAILTFINSIWSWVDIAFTIGSLISVGIVLALIILIVILLKNDNIKMARVVGAILFGSLLMNEINTGLAAIDFDLIEMAFDFKATLGIALLFAIFATLALIVLLVVVVARVIKLESPLVEFLHGCGLFASSGFLFLAMVFLFIANEKFDFQMFLDLITVIIAIVALSSIYLLDEEKEEKEEVPPPELDNTLL